MARKTTAQEIEKYLRTRYCYTFLIEEPHCPPVNVSVLAQDDITANTRVKKLYTNMGTKITFVTRAATIIPL